MKKIKSFKAYSINEEEGVFDKAKKFFTGHESSSDKEAARMAFLSDLEKYEKDAETDDNVFFNKSNLLKQAEDNSFLGHLEYRTSRGDGMEHVFYVKKLSGLQSAAKNAANKRDNPLN
jgi:hypothetical protein